ncbi:hypothetical protein BACUNI_00987 [Bacteroides uniformis ATCC 8492]|uniref:Transmembrane protein n=1 Tax=Bacteroides uniformis (strain ATCC 8492 / DSM 6597 / CCUG 4942 / CIP 103695 / JCM 5828 / KCTC 5204 / NCTC 13054 / VPI 0061) TaxID=411479 RepID=A0ABC9NEX9_BACUC|nr:hypothetical protein BACUNI_00987 [Bacteroides uniformis ATCC 8492]
MRAIEKGEGKFCSHPCFLPFRILLSSVASFSFFRFTFGFFSSPR